MSFAILGMLLLQFSFIRKMEYEIRALRNALEPPSIAVYNENDLYLGAQEAPIELVLFSDVECSYCRSFYQNTLPKLEENLIASKQLKFVYKQNPLSFHDFGQKAALVLEHAKNQGLWWETLDYLYQGEDLETQLQGLDNFWRSKGISAPALADILANKDYQKAVVQEMDLAKLLGINGTPAMIINNTVVEGYYSYEELLAVIANLRK